MLYVLSTLNVVRLSVLFNYCVSVVCLPSVVFVTWFPIVNSDMTERSKQVKEQGKFFPSPLPLVECLQ